MSNIGGAIGDSIARAFVGAIVLAAVAGVVLWHVGAWLVRHIRVEWVS